MNEFVSIHDFLWTENAFRPESFGCKHNGKLEKKSKKWSLGEFCTTKIIIGNTGMFMAGAT